MIELDLRDKKPELKKILLIGHEGTGKTAFLGTMPKPIYMFSFDKGYDTLAGQDGIKVGLFMDEDRYKPKAWAEFQAKFKELLKGETYTWSDGTKEVYKTIVFDNITFMSNYLYDYQQYINNNIDKPGGYLCYGQVKDKLRDTINKAVKITNYVVCTGLIEISKDELSGEIFYVPQMLGSMKNEVGAWFDAVFYTQVDKRPSGDKQYRLITVGDRRHRAKIRVPSSIANCINAVEVPDFEHLRKKIEMSLETAQTKEK